jgi:hypothetical protein
MKRSTALETAANEKLTMSHNTLKGDDWDEMQLFDLMLKLEEELAEFRHCAYAIESGGVRGVQREMFLTALLMEGGDVLNLLRFILSKHGAI